MSTATPVLLVDDLHVHLPISEGTVHAVRGLSLDLEEGEALALVGASGAGKSTTGLALMGLLPRGSRATGSIRLHGHELLGRREKHLRAVRGGRIAMVLQDPLTALNPVHRVGHQLAEALRAHGASRRTAARRTLELLDLVEMPHAVETAGRYPHELSGGMRQRVLIAMAIANDPDVIIADEPASSLDVTIRAQVLEVLRAARQATGAALVLITHDLGLVAGHVDRVAVMRDGQLVEDAPVDRVFASPAHPATAALLAAVPRVEVADGRTGTDLGPEAAVSHLFTSVLAGIDLVKHFPVSDRRRRGPSRVVQAVSGVSLELRSEGALGLVGESGCGKSTLARLLLGLLPPTSGHVTWNDEPITRLVGPRLRARRQLIQAVAQDPFASLDPRMRAADIVAEPLRIHGLYQADGRDRVDWLLSTVGLGRALRNRWPHELSGGQRQRLAIARALATNPRVLVLDEPLSSLDTTVKAALLDLLEELRERQGLAYLYISHDLTVVSRVAREVAVMYLGRVVERGPTEALYTSATHPYTRALVAAIARPDPAHERRRERIRLAGEVPDPADPPSGCPFRTRCTTFAELDEGDRRSCVEEIPPLVDRGDGLVSACHHPA